MKPVAVIAIIGVVALIGVGAFLFLSSGPQQEPTTPPPPQEPFPIERDPAAELREAGGPVDDTTEIDEPPHWVISGEWTLSCGASACSEASLNDIVFEMTHDMMRPDGAAAHSHTYSDFRATSVTVSHMIEDFPLPQGPVASDTLIVEGTVTGSGPIGTTPITLRLNLETGLNVESGEFSFELPGNAHLQGEVKGVIA